MLDLLIRITENVIIAVGGPQTPAGRRWSNSPGRSPLPAAGRTLALGKSMSGRRSGRAAPTRGSHTRSHPSTLR